MNEEKYNGWTNRSTWLVKLHLDNTSLEVATHAKEVAIESNTLEQYKNRILSVLKDTTILKEEGFNLQEVNFNEVWDSMRMS